TDPGRGSSGWDPADVGAGADEAYPDPFDPDADGAGSDPFGPDPDAGLAELSWDPAADPAGPGWDPDLAADRDPVPPAGSGARHRAPPARPAWQTDDPAGAQLSGAPVLDHDELLDGGAQLSRNGHAAAPDTGTPGGVGLAGGGELPGGPGPASG